MAKVYKTGPAKCGHGAAWLTGGTRMALYDSERGVREAAKRRCHVAEGETISVGRMGWP